MKPTYTPRLSFYSIFAVVLLLFACHDEPPTVVEQPQELSVQEGLATDSLTQTVLGKKLENPYSVTNMRKAFTSLRQKDEFATYGISVQQFSQNGATGEDATEEEMIETNHHYVRFWVENDEQRQQLVADSLQLSDIPLDVEVVERGDYYIEESETEQEAHWVYTAVPTSYGFDPNIQHEIIEDLFLIEPTTVSEEEETKADDTSSVMPSAFSAHTDFLYALEEESLRLTGNLETEELQPTTQGAVVKAFWGRKSSIRPKGHVKVYNTVTGKMEAVVGVKVNVRRWLKWSYDYTDSSGFYEIRRGYRNNVRYTVVFKNQIGFKIWPSLFSVSSARYRAGSHSKSGHDFNFYTSSVGWRWATVNNATVKYWDYCTDFGIDKPHHDLRITANGKSGGGAAPMLRRTINSITVAKVGQLLTAVKFGIPVSFLWIAVRFVVPDIIIKANASQGTDGVYETTFHELAHASHYRKVGNTYWRKYIDKVIDNWLFHNSTAPYGIGRGNNHELVGLGEAWGNHVGHFLTIQEFGDNNRILSLNAFENFDPREKTNTVAKGYYTDRTGWTGWMPCGIMHDLIDENVDEVRTGFDDNVSGYSIENIFNALDKEIESPQAFRDRLLSENDNKDEDNVIELFEAYYWD